MLINEKFCKKYQNLEFTSINSKEAVHWKESNCTSLADTFNTWIFHADKRKMQLFHWFAETYDANICSSWLDWLWTTKLKIIDDVFGVFAACEVRGWISCQFQDNEWMYQVWWKIAWARPWKERSWRHHFRRYEMFYSPLCAVQHDWPHSFSSGGVEEGLPLFKKQADIDPSLHQQVGKLLPEDLHTLSNAYIFNCVAHRGRICSIQNTSTHEDELALKFGETFSKIGRRTWDKHNSLCN